MRVLADLRCRARISISILSVAAVAGWCTLKMKIKRARSRKSGLKIWGLLYFHKALSSLAYVMNASEKVLTPQECPKGNVVVVAGGACIADLCDVLLQYLHCPKRKECIVTSIAIRAEGLIKRYGDLVAVNGVSFDVEEGELFGFLGPNGAGKTTTIRMLTGLSKPTAGNVELLGLDIKANAATTKGFTGVVPEASNLYDELTALDNLLFMGKLYGVRRKERYERAMTLLELFRLQEKRDRPFRTLSRGMKRSLTIAAALIHNPKILFLDEPTVGLDVMTARSLRSAIQKLRDQGMTIFLTTHYLEEADVLCDRIAIIVRGQIVSVEKPEELKKMAIKEQAIELTIRGSASILVERLAALIGTKPIIVDSNTLRCSGTTNSLLPHICRAIQDAGAEIESINTIKPTLEEAFVRITGLSSSMMAMEKGGK